MSSSQQWWRLRKLRISVLVVVIEGDFGEGGGAAPASEDDFVFLAELDVGGDAEIELHFNIPNNVRHKVPVDDDPGEGNGICIGDDADDDVARGLVCGNIDDAARGA